MSPPTSTKRQRVEQDDYQSPASKSLSDPMVTQSVEQDDQESLPSTPFLERMRRQTPQEIQETFWKEIHPEMTPERRREINSARLALDFKPMVRSDASIAKSKKIMEKLARPAKRSTSSSQEQGPVKKTKCSNELVEKSKKLTSEERILIGQVIWKAMQDLNQKKTALEQQIQEQKAEPNVEKLRKQLKDTEELESLMTNRTLFSSKSVIEEFINDVQAYQKREDTTPEARAFIDQFLKDLQASAPKSIVMPPPPRPEVLDDLEDDDD